MSHEGISFDSVEPIDPNDLRRVANLELAPLLIRGQPYIQWKMYEAIRMSNPGQAQNQPEVLDMLISPKDARSYAQALVDAANMADDLPPGESEKPKRFPLPSLLRPRRLR